MSLFEIDGEHMKHSLRRTLLIGTALGLYFGYFFRPLREPDAVLVVELSVLAALVTVLLRLWRERGEERPSWHHYLRYAALTWLQFFLLLAVLDARHLVYDWGGRLAVTVMTTVAGGLAGLWYGYRNADEETS